MARPEFTRRFNQVTEGESNSAVARRLGCTPGYISGVRGGHYVLGPELLQRLVDEYRLDPREWRILAGHQKAESGEDQRLAELAGAAALRALAAVNGAQRLAEGLAQLSAKYGRAVPVYLQGGAERLTVEEADRLLAEFDRQMAAEAAAPAPDESPLVLEAPRKGRRSTH